MADKLPLHNKSGLIAWDGTQWVNVSTDSSGNLNMNLVGGSVSIAGADGAILDGVSSAIKATVFDYTNSNPIAVRAVDGNGDPASFGSGTEYTEDAASAANPTGPLTLARRRDTLTAAEVTTDGDNIALNATAKGELYVKQTDAVPSTVADGASVTLGAIADVAVTGDNSGTASAKLRGISKMIANVWDSVNSRLNVFIQNTTLAVTQSGTWNVGTVTSVTNVVQVGDNSSSLTIDAPVGTPAFVRLSDGASAISTLPVSLASVPSHAVTNAGVFAVQSSDETSTIYNGTTALTPKFAKIAAGTSGNNTLVAAVVGKKIRVLAYNFMAEGTVNAKFQSGASGTDLTGNSYLVANTGKVAPYNPVGWFETGSNTLLNLSLNASINVGGELVYVEV